MKKLLLFAGIIFSASVLAYKPAPFNQHNYSASHERATLPASYDSRDLGIILPARDQGKSGCCWAFTATDVAQALFHKNGFNTGYLAPQIYPNCAIGYLDLGMNTGGNEYIAISTNLLLKAPVYASKVGEFNVNDNECPDYSKEDIAGYVLSTSDLPKYDAIAIKEAIMKYGSVISSIYMPTDYIYNESKPLVYIPSKDTIPTNHAVNIIGWNDSKECWIVKNSWGKDWGNKGTFNVSYKDFYIAKACVSLNSFVEADLIDKVYTYNTAGLTGGYMGLKDGGNKPHSILIAHNIEKGESVEYVATYIQNPNTKIQVIVQYEGDNVIYVGKEEMVKYPGVHLHKLTTPVVSNGETLLFEIIYTSETASPVATEIERPGYNTIELNENQWFYINRQWMPATNLGYNFILYVYTKEKNTTDIEENNASDSKAITASGINSDIWNNAIRINIFDVSGRNIGTINPGETLPSLNAGYYVLVIDKKDGGFSIEKFNVL